MLWNYVVVIKSHLTLRSHGLQHARLPCSSPSPGACSTSRPLSQWCHLTISSSVAHFSSCPQSFPASGSFPMSRFFQWVISSHQVAKVYWNFSISPSNEYSGRIAFRIDWFDLLPVQETLKSSPAPQFKSINSSVLGLCYGPSLMSVQDYWKNRSFDYMGLCQQSDVSAF